MKIEVNITKKRFFAIVGIVLILGFVVYVKAAVNTARPYHPLQQVAKSDSDTTSVDEDGNDLIDRADDADRLAGIPASQFCRTDNSNCPSQCKDMKIETMEIVIGRDRGDADPDCWVIENNKCPDSKMWGNGGGAMTQEECAKGVANNALYGTLGYYYVSYAYNGESSPCFDSSSDKLTVTLGRISASCPTSSGMKQVRLPLL